MSSELLARSSPPYNHFTQIGDPVLRQRSEEVPAELVGSEDINDVVNQMVKVLRHYDCVGVAAPQLGVPLRIIAMEFRAEKQQQFSPETYGERKMSTLPLAVSQLYNSVVDHAVVFIIIYVCISTGFYQP